MKRRELLGWIVKLPLLGVVAKLGGKEATAQEEPRVDPVVPAESEIEDWSLTIGSAPANIYHDWPIKTISLGFGEGSYLDVARECECTNACSCCPKAKFAPERAWTFVDGAWRPDHEVYDVTEEPRRA